MPRQGGGDDDRPRKTWREIDRNRGAKGGTKRTSYEERQQEKLSRSPVYEQYKQKVSKMFEGGEMPDMLREKLDPTGSMKERDELLKKIVKTSTEDRKAWSEAVKAFIDKFEMPTDAYLLAEWLDHPKDLVVEKSLAKLEELADAGTLVGSKKPKSLDQKLRGIEMTGMDPDVQAKAKALREKLR